MSTDVGAISCSRGEEALVATDATNRTQAKDTEEPISDAAVGVVEGFSETVRANLSVRKQSHLIGCDVSQV
jgi:hypothetical protein